MREILFRGKRVDNGEWVYGDLLTKGIDFDYAIRVHGANELGSSDIAVIDPETVGQYTGLTDKNGTKIFEGYIVREWSHWHKNLSATISDIGCYLVVCDYLGSLYLKKNTSCGEVSTPLIRTSIVEVIGNIHDNPELLEVEE